MNFEAHKEMSASRTFCTVSVHLPQCNKEIRQFILF